MLQTDTLTGRCQDLLAPSRSSFFFFFTKCVCEVFFAIISEDYNNLLGRVMRAQIYFTDIAAGDESKWDSKNRDYHYLPSTFLP